MGIKTMGLFDVQDHACGDATSTYMKLYSEAQTWGDRYVKDASGSGACLVSVITATKNSVALIPRHHIGVSGVLRRCASSYEIIYVDDGSTDGSADAISRLSREDPRVRGVFLDSSYGQQSALVVGYRVMKGDVCITLDVDLEVPADSIPLFLGALREGADYASGARTNRVRQTLARMLGSAVFNFVMRRCTGVQIDDFGCGASASTRSNVQNMLRSQVPHRGNKHLSAQVAERFVNVRVPEVEVDGNVSSYGWRELYRALVQEHRKKVGLSVPSLIRVTETANSMTEQTPAR